MFGKMALGLLVMLWLAPPVAAREPSEPAALDGGLSRIEDFGADLRIELALSRPVPWRLYMLDAPRRLVLAFDGLTLEEAELSAIVESDGVAGIGVEPGAQTGWQHLVVTLSLPLRIETAGLTDAGEGAVLKLQLAPTSAAEFSRLAAPAPTGPRPTRRIVTDIAP